MNILVTSIGSLSAAFVIDTIKKMNHKVVGTDIYPKQWIATSVDVNCFYQTSKTNNEEKYLEEILDICKKDQIELIIPLTDVDVDFYSKKNTVFLEKRIKIAISDSEIINIVRNKRLVYEFFEKTTVKVIPTFDYNNYLNKCNIFPAIGKKIQGRSSEGLTVFEEASEMRLSKYNSRDYIFQPYIEGSIIVVDILNCPIQKKMIYVARKELTRTSNGAGIAVEIVDSNEVRELVVSFCNQLEIKGCINVEFIKKGSDYFLMDINPRPSAGVVFSNFAGYNFIENHINTFLNLPINEIGEIKKGLVVIRKYIEQIN